MKRLRFLFSATVLISFLGLGSVSAQTQAPAPKAPAAKAKAAPRAAFNRALLSPATLRAKAPETYDVKFTTTKGDFVVKVTRAWAPLGADRFYNLVKNGFYDNVIFFRVVPDFVVQFGISGHPQVNRAWQTAVIKDDPVRGSNKRGMVTFATGGPNTRTTQVFINLADRNAALDAQGFSPFGQVTQGMDVVEQLYSGYRESITNRQDEIQSKGNAFLEKEFPKLDKILTATVVGGAAPAAAPAKTPAKKTP